jgi:hypothetical protein
VSEKRPKIPLFEPSLIHQLQLLGSQQHPKSGVLLTSFSTWGMENSLAEINLQITGVIKGCNFFLGQKLANAALWVDALSCNMKILESKMQLDEPVECISGGDPLLLYEILHLLFLPLL